MSVLISKLRSEREGKGEERVNGGEGGEGGNEVKGEGRRGAMEGREGIQQQTNRPQQSVTRIIQDKCRNATFSAAFSNPFFFYGEVTVMLYAPINEI